MDESPAVAAKVGHPAPGHKRVECGTCRKVMLSCRCPGPHRIEITTCADCAAKG